MTKKISTANSVTVQKVSFLSNNIKVAGNLYYPGVMKPGENCLLQSL